MDKCKNYREWHHAITELGGFSLDRAYCEERISSLENKEDPGTRAFLKTFGAEYTAQVTQWFKQALSEV